MLTTSDNPFDPFTDFDEWYAFDQQKGYCSSEYVARVALTSNDLSDEDQLLAIEQAVDEIVETDALGIYQKVVRDT